VVKRGVRKCHLGQVRLARDSVQNFQVDVEQLFGTDSLLEGEVLQEGLQVSGRHSKTEKMSESTRDFGEIANSLFGDFGANGDEHRIDPLHSLQTKPAILLPVLDALKFSKTRLN